MVITMSDPNVRWLSTRNNGDECLKCKLHDDGTSPVNCDFYHMQYHGCYFCYPCTHRPDLTQEKHTLSVCYLTLTSKSHKDESAPMIEKSTTDCVGKINHKLLYSILNAFQLNVVPFYNCKLPIAPLMCA